MDALGGAAQRVWERASATAPPAPAWLLAAAAAAALVLVAAPATWPGVRAVLVLAHEGGHGAVAVLVGRRLRGVRLHPDRSAVTVSVGPSRGPGVVAVLAAGYPAPALLGLGAAALLAADRPAAVLWGVLAALALLAAVARGWRALASVALAAAPVAAVVVLAPPGAQQAAAALLAGVLLLGAPRGVAELARSRAGGRSPASDADQLARLTGVPAVLWVAAFAAVALAAVAGAGWLLLPR